MTSQTVVVEIRITAEEVEAVEGETVEEVAGAVVTQARILDAQLAYK